MKLKEIFNNPMAIIGLLLVSLAVLFLIYSILTYPKACYWGLYETNETRSYNNARVVCSPYEFVSKQPKWLQSVLTVGTGNIAIVLAILMMGMAIVFNKLMKQPLVMKGVDAE